MIGAEKYIPLKTCVSYFLDQYEKGMHSYDRAWIMAFRALVAIGLKFSWEPKTLRIPIQPNKTVILPSDYISWTKIGVLNDNGEVCTLKVNNALTTFKDTNPNRLSQINGDVNDSLPLILSYPYFVNYWYNSTYYNLFGVGGGLITYGECKIDEKNGVIILDPNYQYDSIILEYLSNPKMDGDYCIDIALQEAVIAFIAWKMRLDTDQNFYARCIEARSSLPGKKVTLQTINEVIRQPNGMKLKS